MLLICTFGSVNSITVSDFFYTSSNNRSNLSIVIQIFVNREKFVNNRDCCLFNPSINFVQIVQFFVVGTGVTVIVINVIELYEKTPNMIAKKKNQN